MFSRNVDEIIIGNEIRINGKVLCKNEAHKSMKNSIKIGGKPKMRFRNRSKEKYTKEK